MSGKRQSPDALAGRGGSTKDRGGDQTIRDRPENTAPAPDLQGFRSRPQPETLSVLPRPDGSEVRLRLEPVGSEIVVDLRVFSPLGGPAKFMSPTRQGVSFSPAQIPDLVEALIALQRRLVAGGGG